MTVQLEDRAVAALSPVGLQRDRLTWLSYLLYGFWSFVWCLYSPLMPFMRAEMHLSYSMASLHFSGLALGLLIAGFSGYRILAAVPRKTAVLAGSVSVCVAGTSFAFASVPAITICAATVVGFAGSIAAQALVSMLAERQPEHRALTIAELVMVNSLFSAAAPLVVAAVIGAAFSWKVVALIPAVLLAGICVGTKCGGKEKWPVPSERSGSGGKLTSAYWLYFTIVFLTTAAEWSIAFWCPDYLRTVHRFSAADACQALSVFMLCMLGGRVAGTKLASRFASEKSLVATICLATLGFFLFWTGGSAAVVCLGLVLLGLGQANCYPLAFSAALASAPHATTQATARMSVSTGSAILVAPFALALCADRIGIASSYGIVAGLLIASAVAACVNLRSPK